MASTKKLNTLLPMMLPNAMSKFRMRKSDMVEVTSGSEVATPRNNAPASPDPRL